MMHSDEKETNHLLQNVRCVCVELRFLSAAKSYPQVRGRCLPSHSFCLPTFVLCIHINHLIMYHHLVVPNMKWCHLMILIAVWHTIYIYIRK